MMTIDETLQPFDSLNGTVPTGTGFLPAPFTHTPTTLSLEKILALPPEEQPTAFKALGIQNRRIKAETQKLQRITALRSGQADPKIIAPPAQFMSKGYRGMSPVKGKGYNIQPVGGVKASTAPSRSSQLADLYGSSIDQPNDPQARGTLQDPRFYQQAERLLPPSYSANDIGMLQQNPQYRGIRLVLPQSGGSYGEAAMAEGADRPGRILTEGPVGQPDPADPHDNQIPRYSPNSPADRGGLREEVYGHLITRGYPVYGGTEDFGGEFPPGFNPVGFGQRPDVDALVQEGLRRNGVDLTARSTPR